MENERSTIRILNALSSFSLDEFKDRLRLQKLVFITRKLGYDSGFSFNWYARGPYSPSLTRMLFTANDQNQLSLDEVDLNPTEAEIVGQVRNFLQDDIERPKVLELIASVWYFLRNRPYSLPERAQLIEQIIQLKPQYTPREVEDAIDRILRYRDG